MKLETGEKYEERLHLMSKLVPYLLKEVAFAHCGEEEEKDPDREVWE